MESYETYQKLIQHQVDNRTPENPLLSVILVAYNANRQLLECLSSFKEQTIKNFEIILIDNGKNEKVEEILKKEKILYVRLKKNEGVCRARNIGTCLARAEIFCFVDDDCRVDIEFVQQHLAAYKTYPIAGLRGKIKPKTNTIYNCSRFQNNYDMGNYSFEWFLNIEGNTSIRKEAFIKVGGWNEKIWGLEGRELSKRLVEEYGKKAIIYYPNAIVYHDYSNSFWKLLKKHIRHSEVEQKFKSEKKDFSDFRKMYKKPLSARNPKVANFGIWGRVRIRIAQKALRNIMKRSRLRSFIKRFL